MSENLVTKRILVAERWAGMSKRRFKRPMLALAVIPCLVFAAACGASGGSTDDPREDGPPDAVGVVTSVAKDGSEVAVGFAPDQGYEYFEGTTFSLDTADGLQDPDGLSADPNNLAIGDRIDVWVDTCAESFPVQCAEPVARISAEFGED